jgi:hypothetical protein
MNDFVAANKGLDLDKISKVADTVGKIASAISSFAQLGQTETPNNNDPDALGFDARINAKLSTIWAAMTSFSVNFISLGHDIMTNLSAGLNDKVSIVINVADNIMGIFEQTLGDVVKGQAIGASLIQNIAAGMNGVVLTVSTAAGKAAAAVADNTQPGSPTKSGPLSRNGGIGKWGEKLMMNFADGIETSSHGQLKPIITQVTGWFDVLANRQFGSTVSLPSSTRAMSTPSGYLPAAQRDIHVHYHDHSMVNAANDADVRRFSEKSYDAIREIMYRRGHDNITPLRSG